MVRSVATLGSHCALQLLKGAKDEGFQTTIVCEKKRERLYRRFNFIDNYLLLESFRDIVQPSNTEFLNRNECILIPHGTLISEVGVDAVEQNLRVPIFGNRRILRWESDRELKDRLMKEAGFKTPRTYGSPEEIDGLCIAKLPGAEGGRGYFLASDPKSFEEKLRHFKSLGLIGEEEDIFIQEYILGVPAYIQYFYSPLEKKLELFGVDRRYETTVDALGRIPADTQLSSDISETYRVVGNIPLVLRESLLDYIYTIGEDFVKASQKLVAPGIIGPFCIEGVYDAQGDFICFEFSARIVAGTNLYIEGSPYTSFIYDRPMSMGRRIAVELRRGLERGEEAKLVS